MGQPRIDTQELTFSISEDEVGLELGMPQREDFEEAEQPGDSAAVEAAVKPPSARKRKSRFVRLLQVRARKAQKRKKAAAPAAPVDPVSGVSIDLPEAGREWQLRPVARLLRGPLREGLLKPTLHLFCKLHILNRQHLDGLKGPVIVASNHTSHFDTPVIFEVLPGRIRNKIATAAAADHWFKNRLKGILPGIAYGAIPFPRKGSLGLKHCIDLLTKGWSVLIFPEGTRSKTGETSAFKPGVGRMAATTRSTIVPLHIRGLHRILPKTRSMPRRGNVWIAVGEPIVPGPDEPPESITKRLQEAVHYLGTLLDPYDDGISEEEPEGAPGLY